MTNLEQAYEAIEMLKNLGLPVSTEQMEMIAELENKKIDTDIINAIKRTLVQKTKGFTTPFKLEVYYDPEIGVSVNHIKKQARQSSRTGNNSGRRRTHILKVTFPDGTIIEERRVASTLVKCIEKIGWAEVQDLDIRVSGMNLVVNELHPNPSYRRAQILLDEGVYVNTGSNTDVKYEQIKRISKELKLRLKIEKVPLHNNQNHEEKR